MRRKYIRPERFTRDIVRANLASKESRDRMDGLLSVALYDLDWKWAQDRSLEYLRDPDLDVVATAILALGHIARIHGQLDLTVVLPALEALSSNELLAGRVADSISDIDIFVTRKRSSP